MTWALSTVIGAALLASAVGSTTGKALETASTVVAGTARGAAGSISMNESIASYDLDRLLRPSKPESDSSKADGRAEVGRILAKGLSTGQVSAEDRDYLARVVTARTGISEPDARKRVDEVISTEKAAEMKGRKAADAARKTAATASIFLALSMVIGGFIACASAALGGRLRDLHP